MRSWSVYRISFAALVAFFLLSCGGGGGGSNLPPATTGPYRVTAQAGEGGSVAPASQTVLRGARASVRVTAAEGYAIRQVTGCGGILSGERYTTAPVTEDCVINAQFSATTQQLGGTVSGLSGSLLLLLELTESNETLTVTGEGGERSFIFTSTGVAGEPFEVTILEQPQGQACSLNTTFGEIDEQSRNRLQIQCVARSTTASLSGTIVPAAGIDADSDVNDLLADYADNSSLSAAQNVDSRTTLHGFASAEPTGGSTLEERFANTIDRHDYYRAELSAGQLVQLQVVDYQGFDLGQRHEGDLDLYLIQADGTVVAFSDTTTGFEEVIVPADGEYYINVYAFAGISKYVLRLMSGSLTGVLAERVEPVDLVPNQMIVKFEKNRLAPNLFGANARLSHQQAGRAALVRFDPQVSSQAASQSEADKDLHNLDPLGYAKLKTLRRIKAARDEPGVVYAEPNYLRHSHRIPSDEYYPLQWHYPAINLPQAWDLTTGTTSAEGDRPIVAVLDTGIYLGHGDLQGQLIDGYDFISDPISAADNDGLDPNPDDPGDSETRGQSSWHGTHVAGTVAAATDNGVGVAGAAWGARIMPIRVLGRNGGTSYDVIQGVRYAAGLPNDSNTRPARRADIANLSLGGPYGSLAEQEAFREARATGMIIVASAGNENSSQPSYPAAYDPVLSVSATDYRGNRAPYSNYGSTIALAAPGGNLAADLNSDGYPDGVLSTVADDRSGSRESALSFYHGTSMAAPHVSGVFALMKAVYPALTPDELERMLGNGLLTDDLGQPGRDNVYGYGLINALRAVQAAENLANGGEPPDRPPQVMVTPAVVELDASAQSATVELTNEGGGDPSISGIDVDVDWLQVTPASVNSAGLGTYGIAADSTGLSDGRYQARVIFRISTGESLELLVYLQVGEAAGAGNLVRTYVILINEANRELVDVVLAEGNGGSLSYTFTDVALGRYLIIAGSDIDVDGVICQSGESCGAYPTLNRQQAVEVQGEDLTGLDFVADILNTFATDESVAAERATPIPPNVQQ